MAVFGSTADVQVVKAHEAHIYVPGGELIALDVTIQFQRPVENVPVIGSTNIISVGRPMGTFTAQTVLCKEFDAVTAFHLEEDDCDVFSMDVDLSGSCDIGDGSIHVDGCVTSAVSLQASGGRGYIANGVTVTFTQLEMD